MSKSLGDSMVESSPAVDGEFLEPLALKIRTMSTEIPQRTIWNGAPEKRSTMFHQGRPRANGEANA